MEKIGVTGRSGGGAYSWFITAVDDRIAVSAPTAGITTLRDHVINGVIEGHCDRMYFVDLYGWDFDKLAALSAPRPLLISNTDKDDIFPLGGVIRIHESTRRIYDLLDAGKNLGLQISEGPHKDMQPLNIGAFHWFERFLKGKNLMDTIAEPAVKASKPKQLRVFSEIPKDEINTRIDETFVPMANPPVPQTREEWEKMRDVWMKVLREKVLPESRISLFELPNPMAGNHHLDRRYILIGKPLDTLLASKDARVFFGLEAVGGSPDWRVKDNDAVRLLYSELLIVGRAYDLITLNCPTPSHRQGPHFPGILKYMDVPQAVAIAAEEGNVRINGRREDWTWALQTAEKMGFAQNLEIVPALDVVEVKKIWDAAPHSAFTSLTKFKDEWFVTFREGSGHVPGTDGGVRILVSKNDSTWESAALLTEAGVDLRDPKFCTAPDGRLMLTMGGSIYDGTSASGAHRKPTAARTRTAFSSDGRMWTAPLPCCDEGQWLWSSTLHDKNLYGVAYPVADESKSELSLWSSPDGAKFSRVTTLDPGRNILPNETTLRFTEDGTMLV